MEPTFELFRESGRALAAARIVSDGTLDGHLLRKMRENGVPDARLEAILIYHENAVDAQTLARTLADLGTASEFDLARWISEFTGYELISPEELRAKRMSRDILPESICRARTAVVAQAQPGCVTVVVSNPAVPQFSQFAYALAGWEISYRIAPHPDVLAKIDETFTTVAAPGENDAERFVEEMLKEAALTRGVSDIHCIPEERALDIRWRLDGTLVPWRVVPGERRDLVIAQVKLASARMADGVRRSAVSSTSLDVANRLDPQDSSAVREYGSKKVGLRFSVIPSVTGESVVIRILDLDAQVETFAGLGMPSDLAYRLREALGQRNGLVLVSGPTGHGKSTTLAAAVPHLDGRSQRILSLEEPVEYRLRNVTQVAVNTRVGWAEALRAFLRHNPDVIIIGEIRDSETAELAIRAALTGHLVLATIHATTAPKALVRLLDLGIPMALLDSTVRLVLGQRLVRRLCPGCRRERPDSSEILTEHMALVGAGQAAGLLPKNPGELSVCTAGAGCPQCLRSGYSGRIGIFECCRPGPLLADWRNRSQALGVEDAHRDRYLAGELESRPLWADGLLKAACGVVAWDDVLANTERGFSIPNTSIPMITRNSSRAFTLIEILVVVAIIGVLAAILVPALNRAISASHVARTLSDLKQLKGIVVDAATQLGGTVPLTKGYATVSTAVSSTTSPTLSTTAVADLNAALRLEDVLLSVPSQKLDHYFTPACGVQSFGPTGGNSSVDPRYNANTGFFYNLPDTKIPAGYTYGAVSRLDCIATSSTTPSAALGSNFYLDGINSLPSGRVAFAVLKGVTGAEAYQLAVALDTMGYIDDITTVGGIAQNRGQAVYAAAVSGVTDVYIYLANF